MDKKKEEDTGPRLSFEERQVIYANDKKKAIEQAEKREKYIYKSDRDAGKFMKFLEHRLEIWDELKDKTFYGKRMYEKTKTILNSYENEVNV
jgi:hypothetical protein